MSSDMSASLSDEDVPEATIISSRPGKTFVRERSYSAARHIGSVVGGETLDRLEDIFEMGPILGVGSFGVVQKARRLRDNQTVALKLLLKDKHPEGSKLRANIRREVALLQQLAESGECRSVVKLYDTYETHEAVVLSMEFCAGGMLFDKVANTHELFTEDLARDFVKQIVIGVAKLHEIGIIHRDLKLENLLLAEDSLKPEHLRIADFGFARTTADNNTDGKVNTYCGTPGYMAPEVFTARTSDRGYNQAADIWSIGIIAYALVAGCLPFDSDDVSEIEAMTHADDVPFPRSIWGQTTKECRKFMVKCLAKDPAKRPSARQLLHSPWLKGTVPVPAQVELAAPKNLRKNGGFPAFLAKIKKNKNKKDKDSKDRE